MDEQTTTDLFIIAPRPAEQIRRRDRPAEQIRRRDRAAELIRRRGRAAEHRAAGVIRHRPKELKDRAGAGVGGYAAPAR